MDLEEQEVPSTGSAKEMFNKFSVKIFAQSTKIYIHTKKEHVWALN